MVCTQTQWGVLCLAGLSGHIALCGDALTEHCTPAYVASPCVDMASLISTLRGLQLPTPLLVYVIFYI